MNHKVVITEYPKSGGTWITSLIGDALAVPKRDIYITDAYKSFDPRRHPWYWQASDLSIPDACIVKSHELPGSELLNFPARIVHLVRDGRDVVVSKYFYERDFCVANGIYRQFDESFDEYVPRVAAEWSRYVLAWLLAGVPTVRYEDFLADPVSAGHRLINSFGLQASQSSLRAAVERNTKEKLHAALSLTFEHNTFVRVGVSGDWRNHFRDCHIAAFDRAAGEAMARLGYH